jgi:hypothetical protein
MELFKDKIVIITGGASGIGRALGNELARLVFRDPGRIFNLAGILLKRLDIDDHDLDGVACGYRSNGFLLIFQRGVEFKFHFMPASL